MPESTSGRPAPADAFASPLPGDLLLSNGASSALLRPAAGGRVCALRLAGPGDVAHDVLYPYVEAGVDPLRWAKGGIYPLVPYSNRIAQSRLLTPDGEVMLAQHPDAAPHTLHGNAHGLPWQGQQIDQAEALLALQSPPSPAWPWRYRATQQVRLTAYGLSVTLSLRNDDTRVMPAGLGFHPYFCHSPEGRVGFQATDWWERSEDFLATAARPVEPGEAYQPARALPPGTRTDYFGGWDGSADIELPGGATLYLQGEGALSHLVLHRPPQPLYLCLEPVTHVADGFNLAAQGVRGTGSVLLAPGETLSSSLTLSLYPPSTPQGSAP